MRKEIIETGKTVDAAIDAACLKLGCEREDCEWEIVDLPRKGFLGLKSFPARVRVAIELPEETPPKPKRQPEPAPKEPVNEFRRPMGGRIEQKETKEQREPRKKEPKPVHARAEKQKRSEDRPSRIEVTESYTEKETLAMSYIDSILRQFGLTAQLKLTREGSGICVDITGEGLGAIIGRRGETLDAIQYLTGLVANRLEGDYMRVTIDCGDYRNKRRETLEALARKLAAQVLKTNVSKTLEPMNPFERRVIHATVSEIEGVTSSSVGEEPNRRVVITTPTARRGPAPRAGSREGGARSGREERRPSRDRGGFRGKGSDRDRRRPARSRSAQPDEPPGPPRETPDSAIGGELYDKVDLE